MDSWEGVLQAIEAGLQPHTDHLKRPVVQEDIIRLTEIKIKRISKFDIDKAQQKIESLEDDIARVKDHLNHLIPYAIAYFEGLQKTYGKGKERKTEIKIFDDVDAKKVVVRNQKLYVNREEGFIGTSLRKDEYVCDCADIDDVIAFTKDGHMMVMKVDSKVFVEKDIIHVSVFKRKDSRTIYNMIYRDGKRGTSFIKRFAVTGITRDKKYNLTQGKTGSEILYFTANPNGEAEVVSINLRNNGNIKKLKWDLDFADLQVKGRAVRGNIVTKYGIRRIELKEKGVSTLKPRDLWFDAAIGRLNIDERGNRVGAFRGNDKLLVVNQRGESKAVNPDLTLHFENTPLLLEKWIPEKPLTAVYFDSEKERYFLKRFLIETPDKVDVFIKEGGRLLFVCSEWRPVLRIEYVKPKGKEVPDPLLLDAEQFISIKGYKALGNQLGAKKIKKVSLHKSLPYEIAPPEPLESIDVDLEGNDNQSQIKLDL